MCTNKLNQVSEKNKLQKLLLIHEKQYNKVLKSYVTKSNFQLAKIIYWQICYP